MASDTVSRRNLLWAAGLAGMLTFGGIIWSRRRPPRIALNDEQVVNTVDALFTALSTRDTIRLEECDRRLKVYQKNDQISPAVAAALDSIVAKAREGKWEPAARRLYDFILGQRGKPARAV
jgi:hypothetical protein